MTSEGIKLLTDKYTKVLKEAGYKAKELENIEAKIDATVFLQEHKEMFNHIYWLCNKAQETAKNDLPKARNYIGFIQAAMWVGGFYSFGEIEAQTKSAELL